VQLDIQKHIVEHAILGVKKGGTGSGARPAEFKVLRTSSVIPISGITDYTISGNANGILLKPFDITKIQTTGFEVTNINFKPVYNSTNIFTRTRVEVTSYNPATAVVTLNVTPNSDFVIHYRYFLTVDDYVTNYQPDDIVTKIEAEYQHAQTAKNVAFDYTSTGGIIVDTDVQAALDTIILNLFNGALKQNEINVFPLETPNGALDTFTLPGGHKISGNRVDVKLNGISYNPSNISIITSGTQIKIVNSDHIPRSTDIFTISYIRDFS